MARRKRNHGSPAAPGPRRRDPAPARRRPRRAILLAIVVVGLGAVGWWWRASGDVQREAGLDVLLITVDTLRADAVGAYGSRRALTPWMDRLAAGGVRFDRAYAHNVVTLPSHANLLSGLHPLGHGIRDNSGFRFPADVGTLATLLGARGYRTGAFVSAFPLAARFGLNRGFDVYEDSFVGAGPQPAFLVQERAGRETVRLARQWLDADRGRPTFCWVHLYEPHYPYAPPGPLAARFRDEPYHGDVAAADEALAPLLEPILAARTAGRTLVVLTSDHGEALGDHGEATHGIFAYEPVLRVPLIVYQPRLLRPRFVSAIARHVDVLPTVLDALAITGPDGLPGRSLLPFAAGGASADAPVYFEALSGALNRGWAPLHGVLRDRMKFIDLPIPELYDLASDGGESRNVAAVRPDRVDELRALLHRLRSSERVVERGDESAETRERLRSLGYLTARPEGARRYTESDDPKNLIALDAMLQEVIGLYESGDLEGALVHCRVLVERRPGMAVSLLQLAHLERESGNLEAGIGALRQAVAAAPRDPDALSLLGAYLTEGGRAAEAVGLLEPHAAGGDADVQVLVSLALALARSARNGDALAALARTRLVEPENAMLLVHEGTIHLVAGDRTRARGSFDAALAVNPRVARAHSALGMMDAEDGRVTEARAHWQRATSLDPREHAALLPLSTLLLRSGRTAEAREYLQMFVGSAPPSRYAREIARARAWLEENPR